jgi:outer membrane lipoprotein SlyB
MLGSIRTAPRHVVLATLLLQAGCAPSLAPDIYATRAVQQANRVEQGVVVQVRRVRVEVEGTTGAAAGAGIGAAAGGAATVGNSFARTLGAIGGGVVGGLVGSAAERAGGDTSAHEYIVRRGDGALLSVTQRDAVPLALGQRVLVITGLQARVIPDETLPPEPPERASAALPLPRPDEQAPMEAP